MTVPQSIRHLNRMSISSLLSVVLPPPYPLLRVYRLYNSQASLLSDKSFNDRRREIYNNQSTTCALVPMLCPSVSEARFDNELVKCTLKESFGVMEGSTDHPSKELAIRPMSVLIKSAIPERPKPDLFAFEKGLVAYRMSPMSTVHRGRCPPATPMRKLKRPYDQVNETRPEDNGFTKLLTFFDRSGNQSIDQSVDRRINGQVAKRCRQSDDGNTSEMDISTIDGDAKQESYQSIDQSIITESTFAIKLSGPLGGRFIVTHELGSGSFSKVFRVIREDVIISGSQSSQTINEYALKCSLTAFPDKSKDKETKLLESYLDRICRSPYQEYDESYGLDTPMWPDHLLIHYGMWQQSGYMLSLTQLIPGKDLRYYFSPSNCLHRCATDVWRILYDIAPVLLHLAERCLLHNDVKPANILVAPDGSFMLADLENLQDLADCHREGDGRFLAPEVLNLAMSHVKLTSAVDIFALGATLYSCITGFTVRNEAGENDNAFTNAARFDIPCDLKNLISSMLAYDPTDRPTLNEIIKTANSKLKE